MVQFLSPFTSWWTLITLIFPLIISMELLIHACLPSSEIHILLIFHVTANCLYSLPNIANFNLTLPKLRTFHVCFCNIKKLFLLLRAAKNLEILKLSGNNIYGHVSIAEAEVWPSLWILELSWNLLTGFEIDNPPLGKLELHSNVLQGPHMDPPPSLISLSIANNRLTGEISLSFCNLSSTLGYLDLSDKTLVGRHPNALELLMRSQRWIF